jgi:hypothetical protein
MINTTTTTMAATPRKNVSLRSSMTRSLIGSHATGIELS